MKKILIASVAVLGFAGVAAAQQAPLTVGNYSANVLNALNDDGAVRQGENVDLTNTASVRVPVQTTGNNAQPDASDINYGR